MVVPPAARTGVFQVHERDGRDGRAAAAVHARAPQLCARDRALREAELDVVFALSHNALAQDYESRSVIAKFTGRQARLVEEAAAQKAAAEALMQNESC